MTEPLDIEFVRSQFPALSLPACEGTSFFESAGGSLACRQTIDALTTYYTETKVQPYGGYDVSDRAGEQMDRSRARWAEALGVETDEVAFGPSTSMNTYVLAHAFSSAWSPGDEIIVTNQDHEANTGAVRRMAEQTGSTVREWRIDPAAGLLDPAGFEALLSDRTRLVTFPHVSNIVGQENDVRALADLAHEAGAVVIVDGVSAAPHTIPDVAALGADVYLFSLYKTYSVHQGLMVVRRGLADELPNQGHFFNAGFTDKRLTPAGPDHAQVAAAGAVLDYVELLDEHHGGGGGLREAVASTSARWREHETALVQPVLEYLSGSPHVRLLGPGSVDAEPGHRCPTVAFSPLDRQPIAVARALAERGVMLSAGHYYAYRVLQALDLDPERGVVRASWVHYTSADDIDRLLNALDDVLT